MIKTLNKFKKDLLHLVFPHYCEGCGADVPDEYQLLCLRCLNELPETNFLSVDSNPIEKIFYGRLSLEAAGSGYYFTKESMMQHLVVEMKYKGNKSIGVYFGKLLGHLLKDNVRFESIDAIVPIPLNARKLEKRGYNQAAIIWINAKDVAD